MIAEFFEWFVGELLRFAFDFLECEDVGLGVLKIGDNSVDSRANTVYVPGGDAHTLG